MIRLVHITTVAHSLGFLRGQPEFLRPRGFELAAITSPGPLMEPMGRELDIPVHNVEMSRSITPLRDLGALYRMVRLLRRLAPDIVHSHTPKGGLLGVMAATAAAVPVRFYQMRGLPMETADGWKRTLLKTTETISCNLAHQVISVGKTIRRTAIDKRIVAPDKITVLADGSGQGVDAEGRFNPKHFSPQQARQVREWFGIPNDTLVVGFVGRLVRDKGVVELAEAFRQLRDEFDDIHLLAVGPFEKGDPVPARTRRLLQEDPRVHLPGFCEDVHELYPVMDVVALPTHREGFPNVPLEAAAMELPVVVSDIGPCRETMVDGETGLCYPVGDAKALADRLATYLRDAELRRSHGRAGRRRVLECFLPERIWGELAGLYKQHLTEIQGAGDRRR